jgi:hypothetical protein
MTILLISNTVSKRWYLNLYLHEREFFVMRSKKTVIPWRLASLLWLFSSKGPILGVTVRVDAGSGMPIRWPRFSDIGFQWKSQ